MLPARVRPLALRPVLEVLPTPESSEGSWLLVADCHIGLGSFRPGQPSPPGATPEAMARLLLESATEVRARGIVFAGDVKHPIVGTPPGLRRPIFDFFSTLLSAGLAIEVVPGNHDVGLIPHLPREVVVHPAGGFVRDGVGVFHGHRWPSNRVLRAPTLVAGHLHPGVRFAASAGHAGGKERCWVRVRFPAPPYPARGRLRHGPLRARELIILPAFNPLTGTEALNRNAPARLRSFLYKRFVLRGDARGYLLDGTDVGPIRERRP
jgi:metallophosphoesterase superfamily enzyme